MLGKKIITIMLQAHSLELSIPGVATPQIITLPDNVINNLEVVNQEGLNTLIDQWTKARPYQATELVWVLSPAVCFESTIPATDKDKTATLTEQFLDSIPFEEIISKNYVTATGTQIFATNKVLINDLIATFAVHGYSTKTVVPASRYSKNISAVVHDSFVLDQIESATPTAATKTSGEAPSKPKSSLPLLLAIFGVLLVVLIAVFIMSK